MDQLINDLKNIDIVFHIGDKYLCQWIHITIGPIYCTSGTHCIASGNHERDWPGTGSFYDVMDSGGECGVLAQTMFYVSADNRAKFWYSTDYGMLHFCIADSEHDWREGSEQMLWLIEGSFEEPMGRESLQRLWQMYKVDIVFYGQVHNYKRTCPIYQLKNLNMKNLLFKKVKTRLKF